MVAAYRRHGFNSYRHAELRTGLHYSRIGKMMKGEVPGYQMIVRWADALGEPRNEWLQAAGFPVDTEPVPERRTDDIQNAAERAEEAGGPPLLLRHPDPPPEVLEAIAEAPTREAKVHQAIAYLQRPELRLRFGSDGGDSTETLIQIVRAYERLAGVQLLPPDVV